MLIFAKAMSKILKLLSAGLTVIFLLYSALPIWPYKGRPWSPRSRSSYAASLTSEGVTIAVEPLFSDELAAQVFDKKDMVTRGIMPFVIAIFNDNDFPVEVEGSSIELINQDRHFQTLSPKETLARVFGNGRSVVKQTFPIPGASKSKLNEDAVADFESKFLWNKIIPPHDKGGGFLYLPVPPSGNIAEYLSKSTIYIPNVFRRDSRSRMIFFEIELEAAIKLPH
jgi:hypothetical protein